DDDEDATARPARGPSGDGGSPARSRPGLGGVPRSRRAGPRRAHSRHAYRMRRLASPTDHGIVVLDDRVDREAPHAPGHAKTTSVITAPANMVPKVEPEDREHGAGGVSERV